MRILLVDDDESLIRMELEIIYLLGMDMHI